MSDYNDVSFLQKVCKFELRIAILKTPLGMILRPILSFLSKLAHTLTQSLGTNEQLLKGFKNHTQEWLL
jgi:hypothetical protein